MRTIKGYIATNGSAPSVVEFDFEVEDDATQEEIDETCWEAGCEQIAGGKKVRNNVCMDKNVLCRKRRRVL